MAKLVYGVGIYTKGKYFACVGNKRTKEYELWIAMLRRCYSDKHKLKHPTYRGCTVSEEFKNFQFFAGWCSTQIGFGVDDFEMDKDLMCTGNKQYDKDTCIFIPRDVNLTLTLCGASRGLFPVGVRYDKVLGKYRSTARLGGKQTYLGVFNTPEEAFEVYKATKESHVKALAVKYREIIDPRAYDAMINWSVSINS